MRAAFGLTLGFLLACGWTADARGAVEVEARVGRRSFATGETTSLDVVVRGALTGVREPQFEVPAGLSVLGQNRTQSFSSINGRMSLEVVYRYEIGANRAGRYRLGPIRVKVGNQTFESPGTALLVTSSRAQLQSQGEGEGPASLIVDVSPGRPYVGQPVVLRVRLVQRVPLAEDPSYTPPAAPGFWSERASQPESYYADQSSSRVLVTETRARLYPLAAGDATVGSASATLVLSVPSSNLDPFQWMGGRVPRREVVVHSQPLRVPVRPLPRGAPDGFGGAVGRFTLAWRADRTTTSQEVPITVRLEVRGVGNLPLLRAPELRAPDFEQFASTVEDSLASPGSGGAGTRRFQWTVLPRHQGRLVLPAPDFAWFDPEDARYERADPAPIVLDVGPPQAGVTPAEEAFPPALAAHPLDPFRRGAEPWAFGLAGLALGVAVRLWWSSTRPPPDQIERAQQREWLHAVARSSGSEFWGAADRACEWLERRGQPVHALRRQIEASRYGGTRANPEVLQRELTARLGAALAPAAPRWTLRVSAITLAVAAAFLCWTLGPHGGGGRGQWRASAADRAARAGEIDQARAQWLALWREGTHPASLAARLAWAELRAGAIGPASLWALRGDRREPRDPALGWVIGKIRETGGLTGFAPSRLPVRSSEWAWMALLAGAAAALVWPRRRALAAAGGFLLVASLVFPLQGWIARRSALGVVTSEVRLQEGDLALEPGQVVTVLEREGARARASAGRGITGWVPGGALAMLDGR